MILIHLPKIKKKKNFNQVFLVKTIKNKCKILGLNKNWYQLNKIGRLQIQLRIWKILIHLNHKLMKLIHNKRKWIHLNQQWTPTIIKDNKSSIQKSWVLNNKNIKQMYSQEEEKRIMKNNNRSNKRFKNNQIWFEI